MCDMLELRQVCTTLRGAMQYFLRLNMARGGHLERTRMLYMPDRYMHGDGEFASTAVVSAYRDLAKDTGFECRDWRFSDELMSAELQSNDRVHRDECVEIFATTIIQRMNLLRQVVFGIVDLLMSISQLVLDVMMYLGLALFEASSQFLRSMRSDLGRAIVENGEALAAQFAELLKDIIDSIVQSVVDTFLTALQGAVQFLCSVFDTVRNIILAIIDFFRRAFNDDTFDQDELREDSVCYDFFEDLLGVFTAAEPAQSLIADQCFTATAGQPVDFPSGFFGAPQRRFTCGLTSMCLRDAVAVPEENDEADLRSKGDFLPAIACGACPGRQFACDSVQKRCKCGETIPAPTACQTTAFCRREASDAVCRYSNDGDPDFSTLADRCADIPDRFIACVYSALNSEGLCQALPLDTKDKIAPMGAFDLVSSSFFAAQSCSSLEDFGIIPSSAAALRVSTDSACVRIGIQDVRGVALHRRGVGGQARRLLAVARDFASPIWDSESMLESEPESEPKSKAPHQRRLLTTRYEDLNFSALTLFSEQLEADQGIDFSIRPLINCTNSKTLQFDFFVQNFAVQLAGPRFRPLRECADQTASRIQSMQRPCPVVQNVVARLADNTAILARYYLDATSSGCLDIGKNLSCVPDTERGKNKESASELWPWFPTHDYRRADLSMWNISEDGCGDHIVLEDKELAKALDAKYESVQKPSSVNLSTTDLENITTITVSMYHCIQGEAATYMPLQPAVPDTIANQSVAVRSVTAIVDFLTVNVFALDQQYYSGLFFNVISLEAMHNDKEYARMIEKHEYSLGRLVRDFTTCSFEETVFCPQQQHNLLLSFVTMFVFLLLVTSLLPIPSVLTFFMWTLGLTVGVLYLAYGFSPLCAPLVPNCLGDGLRDTLLFFFPVQLTLPRALIDESVCDVTGKRIAKGSAPCLKTCQSLDVDGAIDVLMHTEAFFTNGVYFGLQWERDDDASARAETPEKNLLHLFDTNKDKLVKDAQNVSLDLLPGNIAILQKIRAEELSCNTSYDFKGTAWRPIGGLPITDIVVSALKRVLVPWIGKEDNLWVDLETRECNAVRNVRADSDTRMGVFVCMVLGVFDVLAWGIVLLVGIPVLVYVVQYIVLLNLVLLQIFMDNYIVANREF